MIIRTICRLKHKLFVLCIVCLASKVADAQNIKTFTKDTTKFLPFDFTRDLQEQLPALDSIVGLARIYSPMLNKYRSYSVAEKQKVDLAKKSWTHDIQVFGNYSLGNQTLLLSGSSSSDLNQVSNGYRFGVNLGFPLYDLITKGSRVTLAKAEAKASLDQLDEASLLLEKEVITTYFQMLAAFRQWKSTQTLIEKSAINEMMAEKKLNQNEISLADYSRISEIRASADNRKFESEKLLFDSYYTLQSLLGIPLITLMH